MRQNAKILLEATPNAIKGMRFFHGSVLDLHRQRIQRDISQSMIRLKNLLNRIITVFESTQKTCEEVVRIVNKNSKPKASSNSELFRRRHTMTTPEKPKRSPVVQVKPHSYQPSKAELEEPVTVPHGTTPEDLARAAIPPPGGRGGRRAHRRDLRIGKGRRRSAAEPAPAAARSPSTAPQCAAWPRPVPRRPAHRPDPSARARDRPEPLLPLLQAIDLDPDLTRHGVERLAAQQSQHDVPLAARAPPLPRPPRPPPQPPRRRHGLRAPSVRADPSACITCLDRTISPLPWPLDSPLIRVQENRGALRRARGL